MNDFEAEIKASFLEEATQFLADAERDLLALEQNPQDEALLDNVFRFIHNLKGSARAAGFEQLGAFAHQFESLLLKIKKKELPLTADAVSVLLRCNDQMSTAVEGLKTNPTAVVHFTSFHGEIETAIAGTHPQFQSHPIADALPVEKTEPGSRLESAPPPPSEEAPSNPEESIRVNPSRLETLMNHVGELVILHAVLREQIGPDRPAELEKVLHQMGKATKEVQQICMSLRMVPVRSTFQRMQRIVRDTAGLLGKRAKLVVSGEDTEIDKFVLEQIRDPLVHLIRNAVDHGLEDPASRRSLGKPDVGTIRLAAFHQSDRLVIEVEDDGGGISTDRVSRSAIEKGLIHNAHSLTESEVLNLIFRPGFSTRKNANEVSGRGFGMDVVKTHIDRLQGEIYTSTQLGTGTKFRVSLPLTLAIFDAWVVRCGDTRYVIPSSHIHESVAVHDLNRRRTTGAGELLLLPGENLPLFDLPKLLGAAHLPSANGNRIALVVRNLHRPFAVLVDDILGQQQVVIKRLGLELQSLRGIAGSAILGDGRPSLILELMDLVHSDLTQNFSQGARA